MRQIRISNYKNIGITDTSSTDENGTNASENEHNGTVLELANGGVLALIGENNSGKSNVLRAIGALATQKLDENDKPNYIGDKLNESVFPYVSYETDEGRLFSIELKKREKNEIVEARNEIMKIAEEIHQTIHRKAEEVYTRMSDYELTGNSYPRVDDKNTAQQIYNESYVYDNDGIKSQISINILQNWCENLNTIIDHYNKTIQLITNTYQMNYRLDARMMSIPISKLDITFNLRRLDRLPNEAIAGDKNILPNIVIFEEQKISSKYLKILEYELEKSWLLKAFFKLIGEDVSSVLACYRSKKASEFKDEALEKEQERLKDIIKNSEINKKFNQILSVYDKENSGIYEFFIRLRDACVTLGIRKNGEPLNLDEQSEGFKQFFNYFFGFLHKADFKKGDIVVIDEPGSHLSVTALSEFFAFLREFGRQNGVTFLCAIHRPECLDMDFLEEIRIVKDGHIFNNAAEAKADLPSNNSVKRVLDAVGCNFFHFSDVENKLVVVEGLSDYCYLTAFKKLYEKEKGEKLNLAFAPLNGLREDENGALSDAQKELLRDLLKMRKMAREEKLTLLCDADRVGKNFCDNVKNEVEFKTKIEPVLLSEYLGDNITTIETLFTKEEREKYKLCDKKFRKEASAHKYKILNGAKDKFEFSEETKERFFELLETLNGISKMS